MGTTRLLAGPQWRQAESGFVGGWCVVWCSINVGGGWLADNQGTPQLCLFVTGCTVTKGLSDDSSGKRQEGGGNTTITHKRDARQACQQQRWCNRQQPAGTTKGQEGGATQMPELPGSTKLDLYMLVKSPPLWIGKEVWCGDCKGDWSWQSCNFALFDLGVAGDGEMTTWQGE
jgi:hypothetical protein